MEEVTELLGSPLLSAMEESGRSGAALRTWDARASSKSFCDTMSCHSVISTSGSQGRASLGRRLGKGRLPSAGLVISNLLTASCRKGTCSLGSRSSCTVCHRTKPCGVRAGIDGAAKGSRSGCRV